MFWHCGRVCDIPIGSAHFGIRSESIKSNKNCKNTRMASRHAYHWIPCIITTLLYDFDLFGSHGSQRGLTKTKMWLALLNTYSVMVSFSNMWCIKHGFLLINSKFLPLWVLAFFRHPNKGQSQT